MVDRALKVELPPQEFVDEWRPLFNKTRDLSHTRNIIVHQPALRMATSINGEAFDIYSIHIEPYERVLNNDYPGLLGKETVEVEDLRAHEKDITDLNSELSDFAWRMGGRRAAQKAKM